VIGEDDELKAEGGMKLLLRLGPYVRPEIGWYVLACLAAPMSAGLAVLQPYLLKVAIDEHITPGKLEGLEQLALAYLACTLVAFLAEAGYTLALGYGALGTLTRLRRAVYTHTMSMAQAFFDKRPTGRLLTRATSDVEALGEVLTAGAVTIVLDALLVCAILGAMAWLDLKLTLVVLMLGPIIAFAVDRIRRILRRLFQEVRSSVSVLNAYTAERLAGMEVVQLYSDEQRALDLHDQLLDRYRVANLKTNLWDALLFAIMDGMAAVATALLLWYGSGDLLQGAVTAGLLAAFIDYIARLFRPIQEFSAKIAILQRAQTSLEKIFGLLDHRERIGPGEVRLEQVRGDIRIEGLSFAYGDGPDVLKDVSFRVAPGEVVALVGRTGSGKSSIARLLTRTYEGWRGTITLDGVDLPRVDLSDVRRNLGMVRQDVQLFPGDVRFNLALGKPVPDEKLWDAIRLVQAEEVVEKLGGLDGKVLHQGANLSVGEAQLLSFARVMVHDPPVVLLDEATASVDTLTETRLAAATRAVFERKTVIVIAHRLSTVVDADRIVVLDAGRVLEMGTHEELMGRNGAWAALFRQQFAEGDSPDVQTARTGL
jgi:ATP-binding cassette subfamily B multidrug efflux pump